MTGYSFYILLNHSILLPAIAGIIRNKIIKTSYYPFLLFVWFACINETISLVLIYTHNSNTVNANIYVLLEYLLLLYQFYQWNDQLNRKFIIFSIAGVLIWIVDNFVINSLSDNNSIFRSFYSFVILLYSIDRINNVLILEKKSLLKNASFIICVAFLFFYGYKTFVEALNIFNLSFNIVFYQYLWITLSVINCISNILYTIAIVWVPKKQKFILLY